MAICALGYLGVRSSQMDDWSDFASKLLGMQQLDRAGKTLAFRMDDRKQRLIVSDEAGDDSDPGENSSEPVHLRGCVYAGWCS